MVLSITTPMMTMSNDVDARNVVGIHDIQNADGCTAMDLAVRKKKFGIGQHFAKIPGRRMTTLKRSLSVSESHSIAVVAKDVSGIDQLVLGVEMMQCFPVGASAVIDCKYVRRTTTTWGLEPDRNTGSSEGAFVLHIRPSISVDLSFRHSDPAVIGKMVQLALRIRTNHVMSKVSTSIISNSTITQ